MHPSEELLDTSKGPDMWVPEPWCHILREARHIEREWQEGLRARLEHYWILDLRRFATRCSGGRE